MSKLNVELWEKGEKPKPALIRTDWDGVQVQTFLCDKHGGLLDAGSLLRITPRGTLYLYSRVDPGLAARAGIQLDSEGRIKLED